MFLDLHAARPVGMQGISPITYSEVDAYLRTTHTALTPWEVRLVRAIDEAYMADALARLKTDDDAPPPAALASLPDSA